MSDRPTRCPVCAADAQRGQLVCLECGSRITLGYRRPPSWKVPVAITVAVLLLAGAGGAVAYNAIDDDAQREAAAAPANPREAADPPVTDADSDTVPDEAATEEETSPPDDEPSDDEEVELGNDEPVADDSPVPDTGPPADSGGLKQRGDLYVWPRGLRAFTVVLLSAEDRPSATSFAQSATGGGGQDKIGVIRSNDFETLPRGFFVVFAGRYPTRTAADRAADRLGARFNGAFAQLVRR